MKYPTFMVMTANMLEKKHHGQPLVVYIGKQRDSRDSQEVSNTNNDSVHGSADGINAESPRLNRRVPLLHDKNLFLDAVLREHHVHALGIGVSREALRNRLLAIDDDVAPLGVLVGPDALLTNSKSHQQAGDDGEGDEEDAGAGVGAGLAGRPRVCVEGRVDVGLEDHGHEHRHGGGVGAAR